MLAEGREAKLRYEYWAPKTQPLGTGGDMHFAFSYAIHAALVSVDLDTGEVAVERVAAAHDVGRAINPLSLTGQIEGRGFDRIPPSICPVRLKGLMAHPTSWAAASCSTATSAAIRIDADKGGHGWHS